MGFVRKETTVATHTTSLDSPYGVVCKYFQQGYSATDLTAKSSLAASSSLSSVGPTVEMNMGEAESKNSNFAIVGAGSEDRECHQTTPSSAEGPLQGSEDSEREQSTVDTKKQLYPYAAVGECCYGENCVYLHGDTCDMCRLQVLHPVDAAQRSQYIKCCIKAHEKDMELSFEMQRSKDMVCGICMEVVYEKANPSESRFGILPNCNHNYSLKCIRNWRSAKQFESKMIKSCLECQITSNFVIQSDNKACRYFDEGHGSCPFGGNYFYRHVYPDGCREEPQRQKFIEDQENGNPLDDKEDVVTFELGEMLLMLLAAGGDDNLTDSENKWDLFHDELQDFYDLDLQQLGEAHELVCQASDGSGPQGQQPCLGHSSRQASQLLVLS
ncbi:hypothetical protein FD754_020943 [Muntiacus muntjak]|uniref:RING-type E3 ubiquitin transferase n=1 Tax=Muntiacus muntjak TaxID=9888 RepID=A0A5N3V4D4_MUNMU|nr:hypothetical protein FD754_020943 [Muntiacus muntjak]